MSIGRVESEIGSKRRSHRGESVPRRSRIEMLSGLRIVHADRVITRFRTQKTAGLLAYLAYYHERSHLREHLIELLWPEADLRSGRNCLSLALSSLRRQLEPPEGPRGAILRA